MSPNLDLRDRSVTNPVRFGCRIFQAANEPFTNIVKRAQFCEKRVVRFDSSLGILQGCDREILACE